MTSGGAAAAEKVKGENDEKKEGEAGVNVEQEGKEEEGEESEETTTKTTEYVYIVNGILTYMYMHVQWSLLIKVHCGMDPKPSGDFKRCPY